VGGSHSVAST